jgi:hypothetical protein
MHKVIQLKSNLFYNKNMPAFIKVHVHWMNLIKKLNHTKISKCWNFDGKGYKINGSFFKQFDKKYMFNGFKMFNFRCRSHVQEIILPKNMFGYLLKPILKFLGIFYISSIKLKYSFTIMYDYEKSLLTNELFYIELFNFSHLNLFHVNVVKSNSQKCLSVFFFFW